ncbi:hypothetical protein, partial [Xanthomonas vasicola]|uniref:hypothetical protein n=1 Tax=Xanthomonas vasicola TaxID=56459 RepID=UPI001F47AE09
ILAHPTKPDRHQAAARQLDASPFGHIEQRVPDIVRNRTEIGQASVTGEPVPIGEGRDESVVR